jgi:hypothetical protein
VAGIIGVGAGSGKVEMGSDSSVLLGTTTVNSTSKINAVAVGASNTLGNGMGANGAVAIGLSNFVGYNNSVAIGSGNSTGSSDTAVTIGIGNSTSSDSSVLLGRSNSNSFSGGGVAVGVSNSITATTASAFGYNITNNIASSVQIGPSNTAKMTILSTGNVGIGTVGPTAKLEVTETGGAALQVNGTTSVDATFEATSTSVNVNGAYSIPDTLLNIRRVTLTGNSVVTLPIFTSTANKVWTLTIIAKQDTTGGRTLTWTVPAGDSILWDQSATSPTVGSGISKTTIYQFTKVSDDTVWYGSMVWKQN